MIKTKLFTLIELLITIVVIGVLAAIVIPNISNFKQESTTAAMQANIKNIETALTMYALENNGALPISGEPEIGLPEPLLIDRLHPNFLRSLPKVNGMKYWVDYSDKVWASSADSPVGIVYTTEGKLKWEDAENAVSYNVFKVENHKVTSKASNKRVIFVDNVTDLEAELPKLEEGEFYLVNSVDGFGLESPPVKEGYQGNLIGSELPETGLSQKEKFPWPMEMEEVKWKTSMPAALTDGNDNTSHNVRSNEDYLLEWQGDLANRVFQITFSTEYDSSTIKNFNFIDSEGKNVPFINAKTDERYTTYSVKHNLSKRTIEFVVPRGATQLKIHGSAVINLFKADFVDDLSLPYAVERVTSVTTKDQMTINWKPPTNADNFLKVAVYDGDKFLGYSSNGIFVFTPLYSDKEYSLLLEPVSVVGNRGPRVEHTNKTVRPEIVWSGLDNAGAFDSSHATFSTATNNSVIRWEGDLANRQLDILHTTYTGGDGGYSQTFRFYNDQGQIISSKVKNSNILASSFILTRTGTFSVLVPEGASHIKFTEGNVQAKIHNISYGDSLALPDKLSNVNTSSTTDSISLTFNRPSDVVRVAVFRDGVFLNYSTADFYTDSALHSDREYTYTFETYNRYGHRTNIGGSVKEKTERPEIVWSGLDGGGAFDTSLSTFSTAVNNSVIRWEGDLSNRQLDIQHITYTGGDGGYSQTFRFYNNNGQVISSKVLNNNDLTSSFVLKKSGTFSVIVPEGATYIKFTEGNVQAKIYNISYGESLALPSKLTNVETSSTTESITLRFNRPTDVVRVAIFRNGSFLTYSSGTSYTDTSLYSDREYTYTFETYNVNGHRTNTGGSVKEKTLRTEIVWSGLDGGGAFDSSPTTFSSAANNSIIRWEGDLANRQLDIAHITYTGNSGGYSQTFRFYNDQGQIISSKVVNNNALTSSFVLTKSGTYSVIVPEGATHIKFTEGNVQAKIYNISYGKSLELPSKLTNVTTTSTTESITMTFNRPSDVVRVAIFRNGSFLSYSSGTTYTDTSLYSNKEYTYTFETYNISGHRTNEGGSVKEQTVRAEIVWSGLDGGEAFDSSLTTYSTAVNNAIIRWDGDLTNKQLDIKYSTYVGNSGGYYQTFRFYNDQGQPITSKVANNDTLISSFKLTKSGTYSVIVPSGATHIKFVEGNRSSLIYNISIVN